jgi:hypothetical protein
LGCTFGGRRWEWAALHGFEEGKEEGMTRRLRLILGAGLALGLAAGCSEGPQGPLGEQGEQGPQGPPGEDGSACWDCHASSSELVAIQQQLSLSPHGFDQFEVRGPDYAGGTCVACHTHQGFVAAVNDSAPDWSVGAAALNCRTCHRIHTGDGFALTTTDPVDLRVTGVTVDLSGAEGPGGNLCGTCHQARARDWPDLNEETFEIPNTHYGVHYGPQANIYAALLAPEIEFGVVEGDIFGPHAELSCSGCHMGVSVDGLDPMPTPDGELHHTFDVSAEVCASCHGVPGTTADGFDFDYAGVQTEVAGVLADLGECLEAEGVIAIEEEMAALRMDVVGGVAALHGGELGDLDYHPVAGSHPSAEPGDVRSHLHGDQLGPLPRRGGAERGVGARRGAGAPLSVYVGGAGSSVNSARAFSDPFTTTARPCRPG